MTTYRHLFLIIAIALLAACQQSQQASSTTTEAPTEQKNTEVSMRNEALIRQYFDHFNNHAWADMADMYTTDAQFKDPSLGPGIIHQTHQEIAKKYSDLAELFPDLTDTIVAIYPSGEKHVIVEFVSSGTAPDGTTFELPICTIFTIEDGLISKDFTYYDNFEE